MKDKKMIVTDLDGTLLNINGVCSPKSKKYLSKLKKHGYIITIATGRTLKSALLATDGAEFANYIIANAGALIYDNVNKKIIMKKTIDIPNIKRICNIYNNEIDYINLCDIYYYNRYMPSGNINILFDKLINNLDTFLNNCNDILHITVKLKSNDDVLKYYNLIKNKNLEIIIMQDSFTDRRWLEIFKTGVSKYNAIKEIMIIENISNNNVISFGDGLNDIDMIKKSGIGIAMENALVEVKNVASDITKSHNEDGVIYYLKNYLDIS